MMVINQIIIGVLLTRIRLNFEFLRTGVSLLKHESSVTIPSNMTVSKEAQCEKKHRENLDRINFNKIGKQLTVQLRRGKNVTNC